jgi:deoxycytidine triphosphate deaminase
MILSDREISMEIDSGRLKFDPEIENSQISPSSVDLRLSNQFKVFKPQPQGVETIIDLTLTHNLEETIEPYGDSIGCD